MRDFNEPNHEDASQKLQIWMCQGCQAVHFKTVNVMLNFTRSEFTELARVVMDIYSQEFGGLEFYRFLHTLNQQDDEVLLSQTIT